MAQVPRAQLVIQTMENKCARGLFNVAYWDGISNIVKEMQVRVKNEFLL